MDVIDYGSAESARAAAWSARSAAESASSAESDYWAAMYTARAATAAALDAWDAKDRHQRLRDVIIEELQR